MIQKTGKLFINGKQSPKRYDKNEDYGYDGEKITLWEILKEFVFGRYKITISRYKELKHGKDFMSIAFDPPGD